MSHTDPCVISSDSDDDIVFLSTTNAPEKTSSSVRATATPNASSGRGLKRRSSSTCVGKPAPKGIKRTSQDSRHSAGSLSMTVLPSAVETDNRVISRPFEEVHLAAVLSWFGSHARALPWRNNSTSPYGVLVSEVMSQQTRITVVAARWTAWMARWPTSASLAGSPLDAVMDAWSGLGYYARGKRLWEANKKLVAEHRDDRGIVWLPTATPALQRLPGIGPYTAAAVASSSAGVPIPAVDCNVVRVVSRVCGFAAGQTASALQESTEEQLVPLYQRACRPQRPRRHVELKDYTSRPSEGPPSTVDLDAPIHRSQCFHCGRVNAADSSAVHNHRQHHETHVDLDHQKTATTDLCDHVAWSCDSSVGGCGALHAGRCNEALMELGATVCLPRQPQCDACPVASFCAARLACLSDPSVSVESLSAVAPKRLRPTSFWGVVVARLQPNTTHTVPHIACKCTGRLCAYVLLVSPASGLLQSTFTPPFLRCDDTSLRADNSTIEPNPYMVDESLLRRDCSAAITQFLQNHMSSFCSISDIPFPGKRRKLISYTFSSVSVEAQVLLVDVGDRRDAAQSSVGVLIANSTEHPSPAFPEYANVLLLPTCVLSDMLQKRPVSPPAANEPNLPCLSTFAKKILSLALEQIL